MTNLRSGVGHLEVRILAALALLLAAPVLAQRGVSDGEWPHYSGDQGSTKYSALDQIDRHNFAQLEIAWRWRSADYRVAEGAGRVEPGHFRGTPLMLDGMVFVPTGLSQVAALDPATGEELWVYDPRSYLKGMPVHSLVQIRGIESWTDPQSGRRRIVVATGGRQLVSLDARTGLPNPDFGDGGIVDLTQDLGARSIRATSATAHR